MKKVKTIKKTKIEIDGIECFIKKTVTKFGTGAKVDCPKEFLGKTVYLVVVDDGIEKKV